MRRKKSHGRIVRGRHGKVLHGAARTAKLRAHKRTKTRSRR
jgi:hypothetical protein